jgi:hypothetical protein
MQFHRCDYFPFDFYNDSFNAIAISAFSNSGALPIPSMTPCPQIRAVIGACQQRVAQHARKNEMSARRNPRYEGFVGLGK